MILIGLTGGIASGKSTVARLLEERGALIIDADKVWHELLEQDGPARLAVIERFGETILDENRRVERPKLARIVFADPRALRDLEEISHPAIFAEVMRRIDEARTTDRVVIVDAALLVESEGLSRSRLGLEALVVVAAGVEDQVERQIRERGLNEDDARTRIGVQAPASSKLANADYVIDNRGTLADLEANVDLLWRDLKDRFG